jgi:hypothetical protein
MKNTWIKSSYEWESKYAPNYKKEFDCGPQINGRTYFLATDLPKTLRFVEFGANKYSRISWNLLNNSKNGPLRLNVSVWLPFGYCMNFSYEHTKVPFSTRPISSPTFNKDLK